MRSIVKTVLLLCCILWPSGAALSDFQPIVPYRLPADIMQVQFGNETWVYRLYEDGTVKKVVNKRVYAENTEGAPGRPVSNS